MPRLSYRAPKYAHHKASGQAVVRINGKLVYLGPFGSKESKDRYKQAVTNWADDQDRQTAAVAVVAKSEPESSTTLVELIAEYVEHADAYYRKNGEPTSTVAVLKPVLRLLREMFGGMRVRDIRPAHLKAYQQRMVARNASRGYVNRACGYIKTMFRWAVENDLCPATVWQGLLAVRGLAKGRSKAREPKPVLPVADEVVDATLPYLPPVVQDMVAFQRHTGARPGEVCAIRPCDVDRSGDVWLYRPESHKTEHHDRSRIIAIGPQAQAVLLPYLLREATAFCFSPRESEVQRREALRESRVTPMTPSQQARRPKSRPRRCAKDRYTKDSYRRAVARAVELVNEARKKAGADPLPHWHPNQLRHSMGTEVRRQYGLEGAQVVLGHAKANTTEIYAERDQRLAVEIARKLG